MSNLKINLSGYLKSSKLDREGAKQLVFEFSAKEAVKIAKLELMSRDFSSHLPILLDVMVKIAKKQPDKDYGKKVEKVGPSKKVFR